MSGRTLEKARHVVDKANDPEAPPLVRDAAQEAVAAMDRTGKVDGAYRKVKETERAIAGAPVDDFLAQDSAIARVHLQHQIQAAVKAAGGLTALPVAESAAAMDEELWVALTQTVEEINKWTARLDAASGRKNGRLAGPPTLMVIGGGGQ